MDAEREDHAHAPSPKLAEHELAWAIGMFLVPALMVIIAAACCLFASLNY